MILSSKLSTSSLPKHTHVCIVFTYHSPAHEQQSIPEEVTRKTLVHPRALCTSPCCRKIKETPRDTRRVYAYICYVAVCNAGLFYAVTYIEGKPSH